MTATQTAPTGFAASGSSPTPMPIELQTTSQWVAANGDKMPINARTGKPAKVNDRNTWGHFTEAQAFAQKRGVGYGVGIVLTDSLGIAVIDIDHCRDATGTLTDTAVALVKEFDSYTEISRSGTGLHIFVKASLAGEGIHKNGIEIYDRLHYIIVTGNHLAGTPTTIEERQEAVSAHEVAYRARKQPPTNTASGAPPVFVRANPHLTDDDELLEKAAAAKDGAKFRALMNGDTTGYGGDDSAADCALCSLLAFYCWHDPERIDRLFRKSGLMRDKWDEPRGTSTYGANTIAAALLNKIDFWQLRTTTFDDIGNARRFAMQCGDSVKYCHGLGKWLVFDGARLVVDDTLQVQEHAKHVVRAIAKEAYDDPDPERPPKVLKHAAVSHIGAQAVRVAERHEFFECCPRQLIGREDVGGWLAVCEIERAVVVSGRAKASIMLVFGVKQSPHIGRKGFTSHHSGSVGATYDLHSDNLFGVAWCFHVFVTSQNE